MKISYQERLFYQAESFSLFPDEFLPQQEDYLADKVREAVEALPQRQREFILSFYFEGRSYTQVALRLGVTIKKAEKLHQEAKSRLRRSLSPLLQGSTLRPLNKFGVVSEVEPQALFEPEAFGTDPQGLTSQSRRQDKQAHHMVRQAHHKEDFKNAQA